MENDLKIIELTKGYKVIVDSDNYDELLKYKWYANCVSNLIYAYRTIRVGPRKQGKKITIAMHREIVLAKKGDFVDHKNGNTLDNRKTNLRICTPTQNSRNHNGRQKKRKYSSFKGVKKNLNCKTWSARITVDRKSIYLGSFKTEKEAALKYNEAALFYFKEFARINVIK